MSTDHDPYHSHCEGCGISHGSSFDPYSYLVFEAFEMDDLARLGHALSLPEGASPPADHDGARLTRILRARVHERHHYAQHVSTPYGATMHALRGTQLVAGSHAQERYLAATGELPSMHFLVAANLANAADLGGHATRAGVPEAGGLVGAWNSIDEVITALTYGNLPAAYLERHWKLALAVLRGNEPPAEGSSLRFDRLASALDDGDESRSRRSAHDDYFSVTDLLEGGARAADFQANLAADIPAGVFDIWMDRSFRTSNAIAQIPGGGVVGPIERLLHDLSLTFTILAPMEYVTSVIPWTEFHPGLILEGWIDELLTSCASPADAMSTTEEAFAALRSSCPAWMSSRWRELDNISAAIEPVPTLLDKRNSLTFGTGSIGTIELYVDLTQAISMKLRHKLPTYFALADDELTSPQVAFRNYVCQPPVTVTPTRIHTYPVVDAHVERHGALVASAIWRYCLKDLAQTGDPAGAQLLMSRVRRSYSQAERDLILHPAFMHMARSTPKLAELVGLDDILRGP